MFSGQQALDGLVRLWVMRAAPRRAGITMDEVLSENNETQQIAVT